MSKSKFTIEDLMKLHLLGYTLDKRFSDDTSTLYDHPSKDSWISREYNGAYTISTNSLVLDIPIFDEAIDLIEEFLNTPKPICQHT